MKKLKIEAIFTYDEDLMYDKNDKEGWKWFKNILKQEQIVHNNDIGDEIGTLKITRIIK